ncbi:MAG: hypothetical protein RL660_1250 [Bacteroidota bacterium]|jgi:uncharacterized protein (UPF0335 family)
MGYWWIEVKYLAEWGDAYIIVLAVSMKIRIIVILIFSSLASKCQTKTFNDLSELNLIGHVKQITIYRIASLRSYTEKETIYLNENGFADSISISTRIAGLSSENKYIFKYSKSNKYGLIYNSSNKLTDSIYFERKNDSTYQIINVSIIFRDKTITTTTFDLKGRKRLVIRTKRNDKNEIVENNSIVYTYNELDSLDSSTMTNLLTQEKKSYALNI